jgi:ankyrin repeat protein
MSASLVCGCSADTGPLPEIHTELNKQLLEAVREGTATKVEGLLRRGAAADARVPGVEGGTGRSALLIAVQRRDPEVVRALLEGGADLNLASGHYGSAPLLEAAAGGDGDMVNLLLSAGADINKTRVDDGADPLLGAIWKKEVDVALLLLSRGARPQPRHLAFALRDGQVRVVERLLRAGADRRWTFQGRTMVDEARHAPPAVRHRLIALLGGV